MVIPATYTLLVRGLMHLHDERFVTHMDIKPQNILIAADDITQAYVADFGLHRVLEEVFGEHFKHISIIDMSDPSNWAGTVLYQPPEHLKALIDRVPNYTVDFSVSLFREWL